MMVMVGDIETTCITNHWTNSCYLPIEFQERLCRLQSPDGKAARDTLAFALPKLPTSHKIRRNTAHNPHHQLVESRMVAYRSSY